MDIWDNKKLLDRWEVQRVLKRKTSRLTFDCFNLKYKDGRAYCSEGLMLGQAIDGSMNLNSVLRGVTASNCKRCSLFLSDED